MLLLRFAGAERPDGPVVTRVRFALLRVAVNVRCVTVNKKAIAVKALACNSPRMAGHGAGQPLSGRSSDVTAITFGAGRGGRPAGWLRPAAAQVQHAVTAIGHIRIMGREHQRTAGDIEGGAGAERAGRVCA